jgi:hypothetical protein
MKPRNYDEWMYRGLGTKPDSVIAEKYGIERRTVAFIRARLGIAAFVGSILTQEGEPCRSIHEAKMDAVLHWKGIPHRHEVPVLGGRFVADFMFGEPGKETILEVLGMLEYPRGFGTPDDAKYVARRITIWSKGCDVQNTVLHGCVAQES